MVLDLAAAVRDLGPILAVVVLVVPLAVVGAWLYEKHIVKHGRPGGTSMGDALGNVIDVFDPGQGRASRELKDQQHVGPVSKTPERDPDDPILITLDRDGNPRFVRIRRSR